MYDDIVKLLRDWPRICAPYDGSVDQLHDEAADAIEELQADKAALNGTVTNLLEQIKDLGKPRWIPVTERLPKIHTMVLVMDKAHDMAVGSLEKLWDGEVWVCPFADVEDEQCPVTHWMPLPEPPEEE